MNYRQGILRKFTSPLSALLLFVVVALSSFGIFFCMGNIQMMMHHENASASTTHEAPCDDNFGLSDCSMSLVDHIEQWQNSLLTLLPSFSQFFSLVFFLGILSFSFIALFSNFFLPPLKRFLFYSRDNPNIPLFNFFASLFSQGILHPKILA